MGRALHLVEEVRELATEVMDRRVTERFGVYAWTADQPAASLARYVERNVFETSFGNTPTLLDTEYGQYEDASLFLCVIDHHQRLPAGMARAILPSAAGFKSLDDVERHWGHAVEGLAADAGFGPRRTDVWDCATLAAMPEYRHGASQGVVTMGLCQTLATASIRNNFRWWVAIIDAPVLRLLQWRLGRPFETYEGVGEMPYLGSEASIPVWSDLPSWKDRLASSAPVAHDVIFGGRGIKGEVAPPDWDAVADLIGGRAPNGL